MHSVYQCLRRRCLCWCEYGFHASSDGELASKAQLALHSA
jgi:hypothetical protein